MSWTRALRRKAQLRERALQGFWALSYNLVYVCTVAAHPRSSTCIYVYYWPELNISANTIRSLCTFIAAV